MYSLNRIINQVNEQIFDKGSEYYHNNLVQNVHTYGNRTKFFVKNETLNNVEIEMKSLSNKDEAKLIYCSCDKGSKGEMCEHIIASILYLKNNDLEKLKNIENKEVVKENKAFPVTVRKFIENLNAEQSRNQERANLVYTLDFTNGVDISLSIDIGELIPINDITGFYSFLIKEDPLIELTDEFTYNKNKYYIKKGDLRNIKLLQMLPQLSINNSLDQRNTSPELLLKILNQMSTKEVDLIIKDHYYEKVEFINDERLRLRLGKDDNYLVYKSGLMQKAKSYTYGTLDIKFNKSSIGIFEKNNDLLSIFPDNSEGKVKISLVDGQDFIDGLYNNRYRDNIVIEDSLKDFIAKKDYETDIFLLKNKTGIDAKVKLNEKKKESLFTVIGDEERKIKFNEIKKVLLDFGFNFEGQKFSLDEEKAIFDFFKNGIKTLEETQDVSVYYTQNLKKYYNRLSSVSVQVNDGAIDMLSLKLQIDNFSKEEMIQILKGIQEKKKFIRLNGEEFVDLETDSIEELNKILEAIGNKSIKDNTIELNKFQGIELLHRIDDNRIEIFDKNNLSKILDSLKEYDENDDAVEVLEDTLRGYQKKGVQWLKALKKTNLGGILADEMGLGKTIQVIALLGHMSKQSLIIVPSSLMYNWKKEFEKFTPETKVLIISGSKERRDELNAIKSEYDVIITSYPLIRRDLDYYLGDEFEYCILDEAQYIKNPDTKTAKFVKKVKSNHRLVLTGTPIENNLIELWSIFDFILPGYLKDKKTFNKEFIKKERENHEKLVRLINPFILRRKKNDVLNELPEKIVNVVYSKLNKKQERIYDSYLLDMKERLKELRDENSINSSHIEILSILTRLRQICCDPGLFVEDYDEKSGKLQLLEELIDELLEGNHKILIFSQFTTMLKIISELLKRKRIKFSYLDGQIKVDKREKVITDFTSGKTDIFLISLKAGGTGLNLTEADTVIHVDPWWNPAVEDQATDRAHRIGQKDVVNVYKVITRNTIEEKIYEIQLNKRELIDSVIENKDIATTFNSKEAYEVLSEYL
jgi:SNF2 family DNA or RNA helicase